MHDLVKIGAAWLALGLAAPAAAADCDASQAAMNRCAAEALARFDGQLNQAYKAQMAWLQSPQKKQALKDAQRQWLAFRDADCLYQAGKPEESGSLWPLVHNRCLAAHTEVRARQLQAYTACRQEGCPR